MLWAVGNMATSYERTRVYVDYCGKWLSTDIAIFGPPRDGGGREIDLSELRDPLIRSHASCPIRPPTIMALSMHWFPPVLNSPRTAVLHVRMAPPFHLQHVVSQIVAKNLTACYPVKQARSGLLYWRLLEEWAQALHEWVRPDDRALSFFGYLCSYRCLGALNQSAQYHRDVDGIA